MRPTELHPNAENATTEELRVAMEASPTKRGYIRLAAIHTLLMGISREKVCQIFFRSDRMVRLWIECFNTSGIDGLITRTRSGRPRKAKLPAVRELLEPVLKDPSQAGQVHWTAVKLHGFLKEKLAFELGYRTTVRWLHELDFPWRVPRNCVGTILSQPICRLTLLTSIPSNVYGCGSRLTNFKISSPTPPRNFPTAFVWHSKVSSMTPPKLPPSAPFGNNFWHSV